MPPPLPRLPLFPRALAAIAALAASACAPADPLPPALAVARADGRLVLVHFAARDTSAGAALAETLAAPAVRRRLERDALVVELDARAHAALFEEAFADGGRLGVCVLDGRGEPMASLAGAGDAEALVGLVARCRTARLPWELSGADPLARARLAVRLGLWHRAEALLEVLLAELAAATPASGPGEREAPPRERELVVRERLARCRVRRGEVAAALAEVEALRARFPGREPGGLALTEGLARLADRTPLPALAALERARELGVEAEELDALLLALATARHAAEVSDGLAELEELLARYPLSPWRAAARRQIEHVLSPPGPHDHGPAR